MPIPLIVYGIGAGVVAIGGILFGTRKSWWPNDEINITLSVLGTTQSGKTELYYRLKGIPRPHHTATTSIKTMDGFNLKEGDRTVKFNKIVDYSGSKTGIREYFDEVTAEATHYILLFDISKILKEDLEELGFLRFALKKINSDINILFIGSFLDKVNDKNYQTRINNILKNKIEGFKHEDKIMFGNLLDNNFISKIKNKILI